MDWITKSNESESLSIQRRKTIQQKELVQSLTVAGIICRKCGDVIWSRHRHDFRWCSCKTVAIDGGRDYTKIVGEQEDWYQVDIKVIPHSLDAQSKEVDNGTHQSLEKISKGKKTQKDKKTRL
jgi:hypothetical protein